MLMALFYFLRGLAAVLFLFLSVMALNAFQMLSLLFIPFSKKLVWWMNRIACGTWYRLLCHTLQYWLGIQILQSGDELPAKEQVFLIANHQSMSDVPAVLELARRCKRVQDTKWFVKDPIKWVPGIGWGMLFLDTLYVKRNWMADKEKVTATFRRLRENKHPFWVMSFLEGTRSTPAKILRSQEYAKKAGLPVLTHVQLPRTKGFEATLDGIEGLYAAIYDVTIGYEGEAPSLTKLFFQSVPRIHLHVKRYPAANIPKEAKARADWAVQRFVEKDKLLAQFKKENRFH
jgi:1-acyl-sn-glycerol-3-phosphate acyltransferase